LPKTVVSMPDQQPAREKWHALWTRSNCEQLVHDALQAKGFEVFLPKVGVWSRHAGRRQLAPAPMFPGYLFLRRAMDKASYIKANAALKDANDKEDAAKTPKRKAAE